MAITHRITTVARNGGYAPVDPNADPDDLQVLNSLIPVGGFTDITGTQRTFSIDVPADNNGCNIQIAGQLSSATIYVKKGSTPTTLDFDFSFGGNGKAWESAFDNDFLTPDAGTYTLYILMDITADITERFELVAVPQPVDGATQVHEHPIDPSVENQDYMVLYLAYVQGSSDIVISNNVLDGWTHIDSYSIADLSNYVEPLEVHVYTRFRQSGDPSSAIVTNTYAGINPIFPSYVFSSILEVKTGVDQISPVISSTFSELKPNQDPTITMAAVDAEDGVAGVALFTYFDVQAFAQGPEAKLIQSVELTTESGTQRANFKGQGFGTQNGNGDPALALVDVTVSSGNGGSVAVPIVDVTYDAPEFYDGVDNDPYSPMTGNVGTNVNLYGYNFFAVTNVTFLTGSGRVAATSWSVDGEGLISNAVAPSGVITGTIQITTPSGTATGSVWTVV